LQMAFPNLLQHISQVIIPMERKEDELIWKHSNSGDLSMK
jgi:hypothetical protein